MQSFIYLISAVLIVAGVYIFIRFISEHAAIISIIWVMVVSYVYIKYNRWY